MASKVAPSSVAPSSEAPSSIESVAPSSVESVPVAAAVEARPTNEIIEPVEIHCSICSETYTAVVRKKITCKYCKKLVCCKCIEQYLLTKTEDAHCIHCRVHYNDKDLQQICTKTYLKDRYFKHRQEILVSRERANLPGLQEAAHVEKQRRDREIAMQKLGKEITQLIDVRNGLQLNFISITLTNSEKTEKVIELERELKRSLDVINHKREEFYQLRTYRPAATAAAAADDEKADERKKFIRRCMRAGCNGFLSTAWKCGLCDWYSCGSCFTERGPLHDSPHECKKEDLETAELIRKDSKPCPNCGEFINKSSGCNQMYCVSCQTPFDWITLKIVTSGTIHNPHYYEMMKRKGALPRNPGDVPCGGFPEYWHLVDHPPSTDLHISNAYLEFHRLCREVQDVSQHNYRTHIDNATTTGINIKYLLGDLTDAKWGQQLAINEKKRKRDTEIQEVFAAFLMIAVNIINTVQNYRTDMDLPFTYLTKEEADDILVQLQVETAELIIIMNDAFKGISLSYSYTVPHIITTYPSTGNNRVYYRLSSKNFKTKARDSDEDD